MAPADFVTGVARRNSFARPFEVEDMAIKRASLFTNWRHALAFWAGSGGGGGRRPTAPSHALDGANHGFRLVGMPMDTGMLVGMGLIIVGVGGAAYGLLPPPPNHAASDSSGHRSTRR